jgi:hypothetical protein
MTHTIHNDDDFDRQVCEHFNPVSQSCEHCNKNKTMNREQLETFKSNGGCSCSKDDCWYCGAIGDFKYLWTVAQAERGIYANQLERALEIGNALVECAQDSECSRDWATLLQKLIIEVQGVVKPKQIEENAC